MVQVSLSVWFVFGSTSWVIAPPFLVVGTLSGVVMGGVAEYFAGNSRWLARVRHDYAHLVEAE